MTFVGLIPQEPFSFWNPELVGLSAVSNSLNSLSYYDFQLLKTGSALFALVIAVLVVKVILKVLTLQRALQQERATNQSLKNEISQRRLEFEERTAQLLHSNEQLLAEIVERHRFEVALRESEEKFRRIFDDAPIGIALARVSDHQFVMVNSAFCQLLGYSESELLELSCQSISYFEDLKKDQPYRELIFTGELNYYQIEKRYVKKNGQVIWVNLTVTALRNQEGEVVYIFGMVKDITGRKQSELELRQAHEQLEIRVQERTVDLAKINESLQVEIAERQQTEMALKENEAQMRLALTAANMGTWSLNLVTESLTESEQIGPMFGLPLGQANWNFEDWKSRVHPEDLEGVCGEIAQAIAGRAEYDAQYRTVWADGTIRWLAAKGKILRDDQGKPLFAVGVAMDITQSKQAEEERERLLEQLEQERSQLEAVLQQMTAGVIIAAAPSGCLILGNQQMRQIWRQPFLTSSEIAQYQQWQGFHPNGEPYQPQEWPLARSISTGEVVQDEEIEICRGDGTRGVILVSSTPIRNREGSIIAGVVTFYDITERQQALEELQKSHNLLQAVIESTPDAILVKDFQGRYLMINSTVAKIQGKPQSEILGKDDCELFGPEIGLPLMETDRRIMTTGETEIVDEDILIAGNRRTYLSTKSVWWDGQGNVVGLIVISRDISDRKRSEQQIRELNESLERRVAQRTAQLEAANKELEAFSYSVSHDLRAPLRGIDGFSRALLERYADQLDEKGKHYLQRIRAGTQRMGELIDDLLQLSRVTRSEMHPTLVNLSALAKAIAAELEQTQPERQVAWVITPGLVANGDARLLRVVLENLLNNAWKFTSNRACSRIEFGKILEKDLSTAYFVRDNGAGFDMTYVDKLFGAFQRLHTTTQFPGTGIGLATVQRIIHRHGGQVWAQGAVEQGATFYFTL